jgi:hypothetical protein
LLTGALGNPFATSFPAANEDFHPPTHLDQHPGITSASTAPFDVVSAHGNLIRLKIRRGSRSQSFASMVRFSYVLHI